MGARETMLKLVESHGWGLDGKKQVLKTQYSPEKKQNPHAFRKAAAHGGWWEIELDYTNSSGWSPSVDDRLRKVTIAHRNTAGELDLPVVAYTWGSKAYLLKAPTANSEPQPIWVALEGEKNRTLRQRTELFLANPDLALWEAAKVEHARQVAKTEAARKANELRRAQDQLLEGVTLGDGAHGYGSEWYFAADRLMTAARQLRAADGTTDIATAVAKAQLALNALIDGLDDAESLEFADLITTDNGKE